MVREYKSEYIGELADIFYRVYQSPPFEYKWMEKDGILRYFNAIENTPGFRGFVLIYENKITGGCLGVVNDCFKSVKYRISEIFIDVKYQNMGLGRGFMAGIEEELGKSHTDIIELKTETGIPAYNFYKKSGFVSFNNFTYMIKSIKK